jgi:hypothetical protein
LLQVWDLRNQRCLQTFSDQLIYKPADRLGTIAMGRSGRRELLTAAYHPRAWPLMNSAALHSTAHGHPLTVVLYNHIFEEVGLGPAGCTGTLAGQHVRC